MTLPQFDLSQHVAFLHEVSRRKVADEDEAHEVAQITAERTLRCPPERTDNVRGWLYCVLCSVIVDRARRRHEERLRDDGVYEIPAHNPRIDYDASVHEARERIDEALLHIDPQCATVVRLHHLEGHTIRESARRLGIPEDTARSQLNRAHERLRVRLARGYAQDSLEWAGGFAPLGWLASLARSSAPRAWFARVRQRWQALAASPAVVLPLVLTTLAGVTWLASRAPETSSDLQHASLSPTRGLSLEDSLCEPAASSGAQLASWNAASRPKTAAVNARNSSAPAGARESLAGTQGTSDAGSASPPALVARVTNARGLPISGALVLLDTVHHPRPAGERLTALPPGTTQCEPGIYEALTDAHGMAHFPWHEGVQADMFSGMDMTATSSSARFVVVPGDLSTPGVVSIRTQSMPMSYLVTAHDAISGDPLVPDELRINGRKLRRDEFRFEDGLLALPPIVAHVVSIEVLARGYEPLEIVINTRQRDDEVPLVAAMSRRADAVSAASNP